jgi:hypothetical protein
MALASLLGTIYQPIDNTELITTFYKTPLAPSTIDSNKFRKIAEVIIATKLVETSKTVELRRLRDIKRLKESEVAVIHEILHKWCNRDYQTDYVKTYILPTLMPERPISIRISNANTSLIGTMFSGSSSSSSPSLKKEEEETNPDNKYSHKIQQIIHCLNTNDALLLFNVLKTEPARNDSITIEKVHQFLKKLRGRKDTYIGYVYDLDKEDIDFIVKETTTLNLPTLPYIDDKTRDELIKYVRAAIILSDYNSIFTRDSDTEEEEEEEEEELEGEEEGNDYAGYIKRLVDLFDAFVEEEYINRRQMVNFIMNRKLEEHVDFKHLSIYYPKILLHYAEHIYDLLVPPIIKLSSKRHVYESITKTRNKPRSKYLMCVIQHIIDTSKNLPIEQIVDRIRAYCNFYVTSLS